MQSFLLENPGTCPWPFDTFMVFTGGKNPLRVEEETYVGMLQPRERTIVNIEIKGPTDKVLRRLRNRNIVLEFELRYNFITQVIGMPFSCSVALQ